MIYGNPAWEHMERIKTSTHLREWIRAGYFLPILQHTPPCEMTTQQELHYLVQRSLLVTPEKLEVIQRIDREYHIVWAEYLSSLGVTTTPEEIQAIFDKYEVIVDYLKIKFNRARPFQTAAHYGIPLYPRLRTDASDSSYPSGHTFLALCVYDHYVKLHPELQKHLMLMVLKVKQSREDGGVHYPSDGLFSFQVYQHLQGTVFPIVHMTPTTPDGHLYVQSDLIPDLTRVTPYVGNAREVGRGPGAVAQMEPKHLDR